jgi:multiple antibiotic resistance protein
MHWSEYSRFGVSLFVLLGTFMKVPLILSLVGASHREIILRSATVAAITALIILLVAQFAGEWILITIGTSLPSFQIGGGLVILLTGLSLLQGRVTEAEPSRIPPNETVAFQVGVTPLGTPALAGGGSITAVILETHALHSPIDDFAITMIIAANCVIAWAILATAPSVRWLLGRNGLLVMERIFGLLMLAIGIEIMFRGAANHLAALARIF